MAITAYVGPATFSYASQDIGTAFTVGSTGGPTTTQFVAAIGDGEQKLRFFYSSQANAIALPKLVAPNVVPTNFVQCGPTNGAVYVLQQSGSDYGAAVSGLGAFIVTLSFSAGSPDAASPFQFVLDQSAYLVVSDIAYQGA